MIVQSLETGAERRIGPGARLASAGSRAADEPAFDVFCDDPGRLSAGPWGRGDAGAAAGLGSGAGTGSGAGPAAGRPSAAAAATVSPIPTADSDDARAMVLSEGGHMVESTPSARARAVDGTAPHVAGPADLAKWRASRATD